MPRRRWFTAALVAMAVGVALGLLGEWRLSSGAMAAAYAILMLGWPDA